jgi:hypothetical protein
MEYTQGQCEALVDYGKLKQRCSLGASGGRPYCQKHDPQRNYRKRAERAEAALSEIQLLANHTGEVDADEVAHVLGRHSINPESLR